MYSYLILHTFKHHYKFETPAPGSLLKCSCCESNSKKQLATHPDLAKLVHMVIIRSVNGLSFTVVPFASPNINSASSVNSAPKYSATLNNKIYCAVIYKKIFFCIIKKDGNFQQLLLKYSHFKQ